MNKSLIALIFIALLVVFFGKFHIGDALALLLLAGVIPGTNISLTPSQVIVICALVFGFVLARIITPGVRHILKKVAPATQPRKA